MVASPQTDAETTVEVDNQSTSDIRVYALKGGTAYRLGLANSFTTTTLRLPGALRHLTGPLQLVARPIAGAAFALPPVIVSMGQRVAVTLRNHTSLSDVAVWDK